LLGAATYSDVAFLLTSIFGARYPQQTVKQLVSILVGAEYLQSIGQFGQYRVNHSRGSLLEPRDGFKEQEKLARLELTELCESSAPDFVAVWEQATNAA